ncbi:MAG: hypothetical protein V3R65_11010, partial [Acidiferrobacterales bacterium]
MQHLRLEVLQDSPLPSTLPAHTELGVWKRSTGFEVFIPFHRHMMYWVMLVAIQIALVTISVTAYQIFPLPAATERMMFYVLSSGLIIAYTGFLFYKLYETRHIKIRLDLTSDAISITRVLPLGTSIAVGDIPMAKIDEIYIDEDKGMRVGGKIPDPMFEKWFGAGL